MVKEIKVLIFKSLSDKQKTGFVFEKIVVKVSFFCLFLLSFPSPASSSVVINEIAWMGSEASPFQEWIEIFNNSPSSISLEGWVLLTSDRDLRIELSGTIPEGGFYLFKRDGQETLPNIKENQTYKGALNNKGEYLLLFNNQHRAVEKINCIQGWWKGNNTTKQTMERKNPGSPANDPEGWQNSIFPGGTPKRENVLTGPEKETRPSISLGEELPSLKQTAENNKVFAKESAQDDLSFYLILLQGLGTATFFTGIVIVSLKKRETDSQKVDFVSKIR